VYAAVEAVLAQGQTVTADLGGTATTEEVTTAVLGLLSAFTDRSPETVT